jgi:hypothetical protein
VTAPLVPHDLTIPRLPWVPIYAERLWESNFFAVATDAEFRAAFCLWLKSWSQIPPGSLPTDDRVLCRLAELGGNLARWHKVKRLALWHWIECDDGRLYHPVVAELILQAADKLNANRRRTISATENRWKSKERGVRNGLRDGHGLDKDRNPPLYPPRDGVGDQGFSTNGLKNGAAQPAINPKIIGHSPPCHCDNCVRWAEQQQSA